MAAIEFAKEDRNEILEKVWPCYWSCSSSRSSVTHNRRRGQSSSPWRRPSWEPGVPQHSGWSGRCPLGGPGTWGCWSCPRSPPRSSSARWTPRWSTLKINRLYMPLLFLSLSLCVCKINRGGCQNSIISGLPCSDWRLEHLNYPQVVRRDWSDGTLIFNKISHFSCIQSLIFPPVKLEAGDWRYKFEINWVYCGLAAVRTVRSSYLLSLPWSTIFSSPRYQTILAWGLAFLARQVSDFSEPAWRVTVLSVLTSSSLEGGTEIFSDFSKNSVALLELLGVLGKQLLLQSKAAILPQPTASVISSYQDTVEWWNGGGVGGQHTFWEQFFTINGSSIEMTFGQFNPIKMILFFIVLAEHCSALQFSTRECLQFLLPITLSTALALSCWWWFWWSGETWHSNSLNLPSSTFSTNRWNSPEKRIFVKNAEISPWYFLSSL